MKLLAIDSGGAAMSAALSLDGCPVLSWGEADNRNHSLGLLPLVQNMLAEAGWSLADMDAFAACIGPGSFTGLRIACATVQGWCLALDKPALAVSSTAAMARANPGAGYTCPVFDARRNEVYTALFQRRERIWPDQARSPEHLVELLRPLDKPVRFSGDALIGWSEFFRRRLGSLYDQESDTSNLYMAAAGAELAWAEYQAGRLLAPEQLLPTYLRLSEAEEKRLARQGCQ